jgi:hypothetical protein
VSAEYWSGGEVAGRVLLASGPDVACLLADVTATPTGFGFEFRLALRIPEPNITDVVRPLLALSPEEPETSNPNCVYFGVAFSDGTVLLPPREGRTLRERTLEPQDGTGSETGWQQRYWVSPLPLVGDVQFFTSYEARGIEHTARSIQARRFHAAARNARQLW